MISTYARILAVLSALTLAVAAQATHLERATPKAKAQVSAPGLFVPSSVQAGQYINGTFYGDPPLTVTAWYTDSLEPIEVYTTPPSFELPTSEDDGGRSIVIRVTDVNGLYTDQIVTLTYPPVD